MESLENRRILIVDDEPSMHEDFCSVLAVRGETVAEQRFDELEATVFGLAPRATPLRKGFALTSARQGREGVDIAEAARARGEPFAVAFVDMRMPPGWDGLQTVQALWQADPEVQVVFCTAYSPYSWEEALQHLNVRGRLLVIKKPFDPIEVWQAACTLCAKWNNEQQASSTIAELQAGMALRAPGAGASPAAGAA